MHELNSLDIELSPEQTLALGFIKDWYENARVPGCPNIFRLGGYAGTGKTTMIRHILRDKTFRSVAVCAFTGKAADVLNRKGVGASTIHSLIYYVEVNELTHEVTFNLKEHLDYDLIIVDEASMVSTEIYQHLCGFGIPLLFIGDPGQLEPVGENPNLMRDPNYTLIQIHRQALESPIIAFATAVRQGGAGYQPNRFGSKEPDLIFQNKLLKGELLQSANQIICARNKTRQQINQRVRANLGFSMQDGLHEGEKLICLRNNKEAGVFNGQLMWVEGIVSESARSYTIAARIDGYNFTREIELWADPFYRPIEDKEHISKRLVYADFGYCITAHKSQGSEWDHVLVIDEWMPPKIWDMARWRYTAITRAAKKLNYAI